MHAQLTAPCLTMGPCMARAVGCDGSAAGFLVWGANMDSKKNREMGGAWPLVASVVGILELRHDRGEACRGMPF